MTSAGKTILRATAGRYRRPVFLNDYYGLHPGTATSTVARWNPATGAYSNIVGITNPIANLAIDPDLQAPLTDQYSVGLDHELMRNVGMSITYVHKRWSEQIGWRDIGGIYGTQTVTAPNGQPITVFPRLNSAASQRFQRTNPDGFYSRYSGIMLGLTRRYANRWTSNVGYSFSKTNGIQPGGNTGRDPNDLINLDGRLDALDRPHMFTASGSYEIPKVEVQVSGNLTLTQGRPYGAQFQVVLPQGRRSIFFEPPGSYRRVQQEWLHMRVNKILFRRGSRYVELGVELRNAFQETSIDSLASQIYSSPVFGAQSSYAVPRQMMFRVRGYW
jgi:hypothetical protein